MSLGWPPRPLLQKDCVIWSEGSATCMDGGDAGVWRGSEKGLSMLQTASLAPRFLAEPFSSPVQVLQLSRSTLAQESTLGMVQAVLQAVW